MDTGRRQANLTDALRLLGALCVVWYHNPSYWNLQGHTAMVDAAKLVLLGWSMPFFYATSARFACSARPLDKSAARLGRLLLLIVFYTVLYELLHWRQGTGMVSACLSGAGDCTAALVFDTFRNVGNTPGYYMSDLVCMTLLAVLGSLLPAGKWFLLGLMWIAMLAGSARLGGFFLNPLALGCMAFALLYLFLLAPRLHNTGRWHLSPPAAALVLLALPLSWGWANLALAQNDYWTQPVRIALFGALLLLFMSLGDVVETSGKWITSFSVWGRNYAFGIFIFHQLCFDLLSPRFIGLLQARLHVTDPLVLYLMNGGMATIVVLLVTRIARQFTPRLLAL